MRTQGSLFRLQMHTDGRQRRWCAFCVLTFLLMCLAPGWGGAAFPTAAAPTSPTRWVALWHCWNWTWATTPWRTAGSGSCVWDCGVPSAPWRNCGEWAEASANHSLGTCAWTVGLGPPLGVGQVVFAGGKATYWALEGKLSGRNYVAFKVFTALLKIYSQCKHCSRRLLGL